ncbi:uncharacterized protein LOC129780246 [Toxorhynchites rutilus septentrionalis]|uniref:uncharacterized protein LOC129780246 n=1 Tax=Toxorhynchites rutilus septentrionalis TaxID=329112 RepID=UPI002478399B|nr:uncharacterized protein LOC129780246 [Toxorhynchites rutilus septentrionalis]
MFAFVCFVIVFTVTTIRGNCDSSLSVDLLDGCIFNSLLACVEKCGWVLSREICGQSVDAESFDVPPVIYFDFADPDKLYMLIFIGLGGSREESKPTLLWAVMNIPGSALIHGMTYMDGDTVMDYIAPVPWMNEHRFGFYLYEQLDGISYPPMQSGHGELDLADWINSIYPKGTLCGPIASIGFKA